MFRHGNSSSRTLAARLGSSGVRCRQALNSDGETYQGRTVKNEVDADRHPDKIGASCRPSRQKENTEEDRDYSRKDRPPPPGESDSTRPGRAEQPSHDKERSKHHGHSCSACVRVAKQKVSGHYADDRVQQVQEEAVPAKGAKRVYEPQHSADRKHPTQRQD